ncbi:MAG: DEAD/DEAH box helicase [Zavarzinella sp.]
MLPEQEPQEQGKQIDQSEIQYLPKWDEDVGAGTIPFPTMAQDSSMPVDENALEEFDVLPFPLLDEAPTTEWEVHPNFQVKATRLLDAAPWARTMGALEIKVQTNGWKFPAPPMEVAKTAPKEDADRPETASPETPAAEEVKEPDLPDQCAPGAAKPKPVRLMPSQDTLLFKDRLLYLLQPPIDHLIGGKEKQVEVPFQPFPYQMEGIAFLMSRHHALLADEMGLGKTAQTILSIRLLIQFGWIRKALIVCPKPLVYNWARELKLWAPDLPFEVIQGDYSTRRATWLVSNCPVKLINYEILTRDTEFLDEPTVDFDLVIIDEAQRIKNHDSRTAKVVRSIKRQRSWAISGTPIENRSDDLVNIFAFVDPGRIPPNTPPRQIPELTSDCILRRTKDLVQSDMPAKIIKDLTVELTDAQRESYDLAEKEGIVRLNDMGDTITVQHVFQLVMRLKQICNFDPLTNESSKLEQLVADMEEVAANGRKAIVFSQWVEPLESIAAALQEYNPMQFHGKIPSKMRPGIIDQFREDPTKHVLLMSYGCGSVGLNLQFTNYVFLFDRWWNPAIEDQAINRAHRIGQKHQVTVTRFLSENTIEYRIAEVLEKKRALFQEMLQQKEAPPVLGMTEDEIFGLFDIARPKKAAA